MGFKLSSIGSLAQQLHYTPRAKRLAHLGNAESLLLNVDPAKAYPLGYVIHAVTGYRPKGEDEASSDSAELLTGVALQHDLGLLIEIVSDELDLAPHDPAFDGEPVLDLGEACQRFGVTTKTIQRWRRRGLPARRFLCDDGKKRLGFRLTCVEQFVAQQDGVAERPAGTEPLSPSEQAEVVRRAVRLARGGHDSAEVVRRVARRVGRSPTMVLHTLKQHDRQTGGDGTMAWLASPLDKSQAARVASRLASGERLGVVAADLGRPRSAVYRVALSTESAKLADAGVKYHDDPLYHADDPAEAESQVRQILDRAREAVVVDVDAAAGRIPKNLPPYLADLYRTPLLTPAMERALFLWFNFHKCRFAELRRGFDPQLANRRELAAMSRHHRLAAEAKQQIVTANLRLVVSVARKHLRPGLDLMELVSDGNVVLMRAVEGFDVHRGFKFSTYATLALVKGFARSVPQMQQDQAPGGATDRIAADPPVVPGDLGQLRDRDELRSLLVRLDPRERCVLAQEWELPAGIIATDPDVMERVADLPRRQRQRLQREALSKLRDYAEAVA